MIPKIIHYCWFGGNVLPESAKKCIASWKKYFPDFEIKEWNESNYDIRKISYISEAYDAKKYAFVSDFARFDILYKYGGIYFDTDVEVIKSFEDILDRGPFMGCEVDGSELSKIQVAPGLGMAIEANNPFYGKMIKLYESQCFILKNGEMNLTTVVKYTTSELMKRGLKNIPEIQSVDGIVIYPKEYFNPCNFETGKLVKTENTHSIHWYTMSWMSPFMQIRSKATRVLHRIFGVDIFKRLRKK